ASLSLSLHDALPIFCSTLSASAPSSKTTKQARLCFSAVSNVGFSPLLTRFIASSDGKVYCTPDLTPSTRRTASECPWLNPFPQRSEEHTSELSHVSI